MSKPKDRHFLEAVLMNGEAAVDAMTDNEAVRAIPVVGTAIKLLKGVDDLRERALAAKLAKFLNEPALQRESAKAKLHAQAMNEHEDGQKIGEALFLVLERMTDLDKPGLLAKVFVAYLDGVVSAQDLRRLAHAMSDAFIDDLLALQAWEASMHAAYGSEWKEPLVGAGLTRVVAEGSSGDAASFWKTGAQLHYELTPLGRTLHRALWHAEQAATAHVD